MTAKNTKSRLGFETLESREMMSVTNPWFRGNLWVIPTDNSATSVRVTQSDGYVVVTETTTGRFWRESLSRVGRVEFQGGAGNDRFINAIPTMPVNAFGFGGNDHLEGYSAADYLNGGEGKDTLLGFAGHDTLYGGSGNDQLNGGAGNDTLRGQGGDDVLVAIDGALGDTNDGGFGGFDTIWVDGGSGTTDVVDNQEAADKYQIVNDFANGADRTLNRDRIADPLARADATYRTFSNRPLFSSSGPRVSDIEQGTEGDCWLLAELGAICIDSPRTIRQRVVDFNDGTYGVRLGNSFYRVDNDLPTLFGSSTTMAYASLGAENSMWVAIIEKAYASYRTGLNTYASLNNGWSSEAAAAFGATNTGEVAIDDHFSATSLANTILTHWNNYEAVTVGFTDNRYGKYLPYGLVNNHMYTVTAIQMDGGVVTSITLRNPWGVDTDLGTSDGSDNGYVTVTPAQLFYLSGAVNWGRVA